MKKTGEFEKQLKELLFLQFDVDGGHSAQKKVISIVDEARKEFPRFLKPINPTIATIDAITFKVLATKWFEKWFGVEK